MAKKRNIIVVIILSLLTCGIYPIILFAKVTNESNAVAKSDKTAGGFLAIVFMILTGGIYGLYWAYKLGKKLNTATKTLNPWLYLLLHNFFWMAFPVAQFLAVLALNKIADQPVEAVEAPVVGEVAEEVAE